MLDVVSPGAMRVKVKVNQVDVHRLTVGMAARVTLDAYPERSHPARLAQISPIATPAPVLGENPHVRGHLRPRGPGCRDRARSLGRRGRRHRGRHPCRSVARRSAPCGPGASARPSRSLGLGGWYALGPTAAADGGVETAEAVRGDFIDVLPVRGEVRARRTVPITAPQGAGDLQVVFLAPSGSAVKTGDIVVRFDTSTTERQLAEKRSALREAEAEIQRARADATISAQAAKTDQTKRRYDVERAKLDASTSEVVSRLEAEKATLSLGAAEQRAREAAIKVTANAATSDASMGALERRREKALADVRLEETRLAALTLKAPLAGVITLGTNFRAGGPFAQREWRAGDQAWAGASIAQIPALDSLYILAKVDETDRGQLKTGLEADVEVQAVGGKPAPARITAFSALAKVDFGSIWPPPRLFDVQLDLGTPNPALRPGMTASIKIRRDKVPQALLVPTRGAVSAVWQDHGAGRRGHAGRGVRARSGAASSGAASASRGAVPTSLRLPSACSRARRSRSSLPEEIVEP